MKIGTYDTPYLKKYGVEAGYRRIAELGYECIDFGDFCNTDVPLFQMNDADFECELNTLRRLFGALRCRHHRLKLLQYRITHEKLHTLIMLAVGIGKHVQTNGILIDREILFRRHKAAEKAEYKDQCRKQYKIFHHNLREYICRFRL